MNNYGLTKKDRMIVIFREYRKAKFNLFDIWEKNILMGREETDEGVYTWYQEMLDFTNLIMEDTKPSDFPTTPPKIQKYL